MTLMVIIYYTESPINGRNSSRIVTKKLHFLAESGVRNSHPLGLTVAWWYHIGNGRNDIALHLSVFTASNLFER